MEVYIILLIVDTHIVFMSVLFEVATSNNMVFRIKLITGLMKRDMS